MRPSCTYCARKHLAQALILLQETEQGYPDHFWLALGHLAEASDELLWEHPVLANNIREQRKALETAHTGGTRMSINIMDFIAKCGEVDKQPAATPRHGHEVTTLLLTAQPAPFPKVSYDPADYPERKTEARRAAEYERGVSVIAAGVPDTPMPANIAVGLPALQNVAPKGCGGCQQAKDHKKTIERWQSENASGSVKRRFVIIATLTDFDPSYSLVSVVLDQARAAAMLPDTTVHVLVHVNARMENLSLPSNIEVTPCIPVVGAPDDVALEATALFIAQTIEAWLKGIGPCTVMTHDLVFQSGLLTYARALHTIAVRASLPDVRFYHMIHSSVGRRPKTDAAQWRATIPAGHTMAAVNYADVPYLSSYYQAPAERFVSLPNPRDVRVFLGLQDANTAAIVTKHALHLANYLQVFPLSAPRMTAKGVTKVIDVFRALLTREGGDPATVRLVIADAHANGAEGKSQKTLMRRYAEDIGLPHECLVFVSDFWEGVQAGDAQLSKGLDAPTVRALMQIANVFVFPTISEAGSLVLMEAALAGNLLVLNATLPCLHDYVDGQDAIWVPFGSVKEPGVSVDYAEVAEMIEVGLARSMSQQAKLAIMQKHCLEAYAVLLSTRLQWTPPFADLRGVFQSEAEALSAENTGEPAPV